MVDLSDRFAKCCDKAPIKPSSPDLAFFEFRGEGSYDAVNKCVCGYYEIAHIKGRTHECNGYCRHCNDFRPHGPYEFDMYYCGHMGWD